MAKTPPQARPTSPARRRTPQEEYLPHVPPAVTRRVAVATKALAAGNADPQQQIFMFNYIVRDLCKTFDLSYRPGEIDAQRATDFAEGKRWVGLRLVHLFNYPVSLLDKDD